MTKSLSLAAVLILAALVAVPAGAAPEAPGTPVIVSGELAARTVTVEEPGDILNAVLTIEVVCGATAPAECIRFQVVCGHAATPACSEPAIGSAVAIVARLRSADDGVPTLVFERFK